jgi:hypothetical protein
MSVLFRLRQFIVPALLGPGCVLAAHVIEIDGRAWRATEIACEKFAAETWRERWVVEGNAALEVRDGRLHVATRQTPDLNQSATLWWREPLPANVLVEMTAGAAPAGGEANAANLNLFFHAREPDGSPYRFGRSGDYPEYHRIPNYIITLTGGFQPGWSRVRRNPGFVMLAEEPSTRSEPGQTYRIRVLIAGGRIRYWLGDRLVHDTRDPEPLPGGHFALRTWRSQVWWSDIRISSLSPEPADTPGSRAYNSAGTAR